MYNGQSFSDLIYQFYSMRIQFGYYTEGDTLPPIETLSRDFRVSTLTVKTALKQLRDEGYIITCGGKATKVNTSHADPASAVRFLSARMDRFADFYPANEMIFSSLLTESFRLMEEKDFTCLLELADRLAADDLMRFYSFALQKLNNSLVMNLLWESSLYQGLPFLKAKRSSELYDLNKIRRSLKNLIRSGKEKDFQAVHSGFLNFQRTNRKHLVEFYAEQTVPVPKEEQTPFVWHIYRERPEICYSLASHILHQIYLGHYHETHFLPSYEKMAELYGVSVSTARRTIRLLCQLGAAQSINGKGTRIFSMEESWLPMDCGIPSIRRSLAFFIQALELVKYTCRDVSQKFLKKLTRQSKNALLQVLEHDLTFDRSELTLLHIVKYIAEYHPCAGIREIYFKLFELMLWGYPIMTGLKESDSQRKCVEYAEMIIHTLKTNDFLSCADAIGQLAVWKFSAADDALCRCGFDFEAFRLLPSIQLM